MTICYPEVTCYVATIVEPPMATKKIDKTQYPFFMRPGCLTALIPENHVDTERLKKAFTYYQACVSLAYKKKDSSPVTRELLEEQMAYTENAIAQSALQNEIRLRYLSDTMSNIYSVDGVINT